MISCSRLVRKAIFAKKSLNNCGFAYAMVESELICMYKQCQKIWKHAVYIDMSLNLKKYVHNTNINNNHL